MKTYIKKITAFCSIISLLAIQTVALAQSFGPPMQATAVDTIAGYSTTLKSSRGTPHEQVVFQVENPLGTLLELEATANEVGVASVDLYGFHTRKAGEYTASVCYRDCAAERPRLSTFQVYPDNVDPVQSQISVNPAAIVADGRETAIVKVLLRDKYRNPVPDHRVTVVSSRRADTLRDPFPNEPTNHNGEKVFEIASAEPGVSYLTALDATSALTLDARTQIVFFEQEQRSSSSGNPFQANIFQDEEPATVSGPVARFELQFTGPNNTPNRAVVGSDQNYFTITAVDAQGQRVSDYTGSILISVPDDANAILPNNGQYTFLPKDQGSFQFSLAFQFSQTGTQDVQVFAYDPDTGEIFRNIRGETSVEVVTSADVNDPGDTGSSPEIEIKSPTEGNTYASAAIALSGKAAANSDLKVFLDGTEAQTIPADPDGVFFATLENMAEGTHQLYVQETTGERRFSETISFAVDTGSPLLQAVELYPRESVEAGNMVTITVISEPKLGRVAVLFSGEEYTLSEIPNQPGNYERSVPAPAIPGEYPVDVQLQDALGNESKFLSQATITVREKAGLLPETPGEVELVPQPGALEVSWLPVENAALYIVAVGTSEFSLTDKVSVPANKSGVLIEELAGGTEYFVQVRAMNATGDFSLPSAVLSARPLFADQTSGGLRVIAASRDGAITLNWEPQPELPDGYLIRYGIRPGEYVEQVTVSRLQTSAVISDLINGLPYYFQIVAYKDRQAFGGKYAQVSATPRFSGLHPAATQPTVTNAPHNVASGPAAALIFIGGSFLLTAFFFAFRRRKNYGFRMTN